MKKIILDLTQPEQIIEVTEDSQILGLYIGRDISQVKTQIKVIHNSPGLKSNTKIKAVLYDQAQLDVRGDLIINKGAKQTDTYLKIDVLMISEGSKAVAVPSLEIMEDEVKGGHGATVGNLDEEQLFYLTARGLNKKEALEVLVEGFIADIQGLIER